jgi:hypothetical protein
VKNSGRAFWKKDSDVIRVTYCQLLLLLAAQPRGNGIQNIHEKKNTAADNLLRGTIGKLFAIMPKNLVGTRRLAKESYLLPGLLGGCSSILLK